MMALHPAGGFGIFLAEVGYMGHRGGTLRLRMAILARCTCFVGDGAGARRGAARTVGNAASLFAGAGPGGMLRTV